VTQLLSDSIVITGTGLACGLGLDAEATWKNVLAGRRGIGPMPAMESALPPDSDGGQALDLPGDFAPGVPREARYLRYVIEQALHQAGDLPYPPARRATMLGTTLHGMRAGGRFLRTGDVTQLRDFLAGDVTRRATSGLNLHGGSATTCSACSSGLGAIALGITLLRTGQADVVVAGGYDPVSEYAWAGFNALRLVSGPPLRPFAKGRSGMKLAEAYAVVVLERASDAQQRGARVVATVAGYGESADAHHLTQPHPQGRGALAAMQQAIRAANLTTSDIGLVAAHATGTPDNDAAEYAAMHALFDARLADVPVVAFKGHLGHTLGGAGAAELILSAFALRDAILPPTLLDASEETEFSGLRLTRGTPTPATLHATLNTSLGFGGANTSIVLTPPANFSGPPPLEGGVRGGVLRTSSDLPARPNPSPYPLPQGEGEQTSGYTSMSYPHRRNVVITGVGVILPGVYDRESFRARIHGTTSNKNVPNEKIDFARVEAIAAARRMRRMSDYVKLTLAAATLATRDAFGESLVPAGTSAVLGTTHGSASFSETYYRQLIGEGIAAANPLLFAEGVPNAAAAQLSLMLNLTGPCQTIVGTRTSGLDAVRLTMLRIAAGEWDCCLVSAGEEDSAVVSAAYAACGASADDTAGAVALVLESADSAVARGATVLATLTHAAAASGPGEAGVEITARTLAALPPADRIFAGGRTETLAARRAERHESPFECAALGDRFSVTPLVALAAAIEAGGSFILTSTDPSGTAVAVRVEASGTLVPSPGTPGEGWGEGRDGASSTVGRDWVR
jgi:3-oxoacyl-[acyl-carrier-protein] synthase II